MTDQTPEARLTAALTEGMMDAHASGVRSLADPSLVRRYLLPHLAADPTIAADLALAAAVRGLPDYAMFGPYPDQHGKRSWRVTLDDGDDDRGGATFVAHDDEADPTAAIIQAAKEAERE